MQYILVNLNKVFFVFFFIEKNFQNLSMKRMDWEGGVKNEHMNSLVAANIITLVLKV